MTQTMNLNKTGLEEMSLSEMEITNGGGFFEWIGEVIGKAAHLYYNSVKDIERNPHDWATFAEK
jgi:hypothetical protein